MPYQMSRNSAVPNGDFATLVNDWLPDHKDSTGQIAVLEFNHPADCHNQCIAAEYGQDDFGSQATWKERAGTSGTFHGQSDCSSTEAQVGAATRSVTPEPA